MESHTIASKEFQYGVCSQIIRMLDSENQLIYIEDSLGHYCMSNSGITLNIRVSSSVSSDISGKLHIGDDFEFNVVKICTVIDPKDPGSNDLVTEKDEVVSFNCWVVNDINWLTSK